ncbi:hypothetical protein M6B38_356685 [Iris pallida]|uniref:Uncharacterized protein n=1 Tax=Iris pallida TaxID=29817 RepID=A0AAX6GMB5_IRIPA|nr:hypothetical protein M6B38_356685 [Iris pallida]
MVIFSMCACEGMGTGRILPIRFITDCIILVYFGFEALLYILLLFWIMLVVD